MRLTDSTVVRQLANGRVVVLDTAEHRPVAQFVAPEAVFPCGDLYEGYPEFTKRPGYEGDWYPDSPSDLIQTCTAPRVAFENGSACCAGHVHFTDSQYFTEDEAEACLRANGMLPPNARLMDGSECVGGTCGPSGTQSCSKHGREYQDKYGKAENE